MNIRSTYAAVGGAFLLLLQGVVGSVAADAKAAGLDSSVDKAIDRGLEFLAALQVEEGFFTGEGGDRLGVVSLSGMAFLAKGHTPGQGRYGILLNRCIDYVIKTQQPDGVLARGNEGNGAMYSHNISTLFLSEVSGMVDEERQKRLDAALAKAVKILLEAQAVKKDGNHKGGWRYQKNSGDSDLSCSGWALMALRSARLNGAPVPNEAIKDAGEYIMRRHNPATGQFGYQDQERFSVTLTGAALLCLELTGHHGEPSTIKAGDYILRCYEQELPKQERPFYGNYYNAQAMFQLGGKYWEKYSNWMYAFWMPKQKADGSWQGDGPGPAYSTAMMLLALTVPYRQLPIYQRDETVDEKE